MKKLISLLAILSIFTIGCFNNTTSAFFDGAEKESNTHMTHSSNTIDWINISDSSSSDCLDDIHDCCFSPLEDTSHISFIHTVSSKDKKIKWKVFDNDFLAIIQENQKSNYDEKLKSPPLLQYENSENGNFYVTLIGIIKNNS